MAPACSPWQVALSKITVPCCRLLALPSWGTRPSRPAPGTSCACGCAVIRLNLNRESLLPLTSPPTGWITRVKRPGRTCAWRPFTSRPGHADQLHLDLWWRGYNLAQDAGTNHYNDPPPWNNVLRRTGVHNTISVDGLDQMTLAGRFLWLDWAQARLIDHARSNDLAWERLTAQHDGYRRLGVIHQRSVTCCPRRPLANR